MLPQAFISLSPSSSRIFPHQSSAEWINKSHSIRAVAAQFEINKNTIVEWKKRIEIKKTRVRKPSKINDDALREDVEKYPDAYQYERAARFNCGVSSIGAALKRLNIIVKKRR